jgi:hypothetical protein
MSTINRRQFLKLAAGLGAAIALEPIKLAAATDFEIESLWTEISETPILFDVSEYGTISVADYPAPSCRRDVYSLGHLWEKNAASLADEADSCIPLFWFISKIHREEFYNKSDELHSKLLDESRDPQEITRQLYKFELAWGSSENPVAVFDWIRSLRSNEFDALVMKIVTWLDDEPNWTSEYEYFSSGADGQSSALSFFRDLETGYADALGIIIVEGEHPGSSYYAAELKFSAADANRVAAEKGIPIRFREVI